MLKRFIYQDLIKWKKDGAKTALCITGARKIGKSTVARTFGNEYYRQVIEINFISHPEMKRIFDSPNPETIFPALTALTGQPILKDSTLLILEEIQECPIARTAIKFLVQDHRTDIIETWSLKRVNLGKVQSYPVGFESLLPMYPMTFEEFLWAMNIPDSTVKYLKDCCQNEKTVNAAVHEKMMNLFCLYMVIGGMPEAVQTYINTSDLSRVRMVQKEIISLYQSEIFTYANRRCKLKILEVFNSIAGQLSTKNRRFKIARIDPGMRYEQFKESLLWLEEAGMTLPCSNVSKPVSPLAYNRESAMFKLYLSDTGLLCALMSEQQSFDVLKGLFENNLKGVLENAFAQELKSRNLDLFYFDSKRQYNLDFLVQNHSRIDVIEVRPGIYYKKHASLTKALEQPDWNLQKGFVFCKGNIERSGSILYLPLYMIMFYDLDRLEEFIWEPDLSILQNF